MKKILLGFILILNTLYGISPSFIKQMEYETSYNKALEKAKQQNKNLMLLVVQKSCPWCRKMEKQTLKKKNIDSLIKKSFIPVIVDEALNNFPKKFEAKLFPTVMFIDVKNEKLLSKVLGYKNKKEFEEILKKVN